MAKYITECKLNIHISDKAGKIAIVTMDNGQSAKIPNTWSDEALESLSTVLDQVEVDPDLQGWVLTGNAGFFSAGADIMSVNLSATRQEALLEGQKGHAVFKRIMDLDMPTIAAINGVAFGGGLESALYHDFRTISNHSNHKCSVAFPECYMGLIPGWGGTQLVPRIAGAKTAVEMMIKNPLNGNRMTKPKRLLELGLVDQIMESENFLDQTIDFMEKIIIHKHGDKKKSTDPKMSESLYKEAFDFIKEKVHSGTKAPYKALDLIRQASTIPLNEGFEKEDEALAQMLVSRQFKASIYSFDLVQRRVKKSSKRFSGIEAKNIKTIGVIGENLKSTDIAKLFFELPKVLVIREDFNQPDINFDIFENCELVIESATEDLRQKQEIFHKLEAVCHPDCLFLSHTSYQDIDKIVSGLNYPSRLAGFHLLDPIFKNPLVEIIKLQHTNDSALAQIFSTFNEIKKIPILVKNAPGFLVGHILGAMIDGGITCLKKGFDYRQIEKSIVDMGFPIHSIGLLQFTKTSTKMNMQKSIIDRWPERFNNLEQVTSIDGKQLEKSRITDSEWSGGEENLIDPEINEIIMTRMAVEIDHILKQGVVESYKDVDTAMILGAGWPFFNGGITALLDSKGYSKKVLGLKISETNYNLNIAVR